ncbi:MAG: 50S ribosomal protein L30 [Gammaproteobacteria bacterium]|nr:50S ribosomal protein L30 [Gammaproteobacteria bacterium]
MSGKRLQIKLVKSIAGRLEAHQQSVRGLGLRRLNHTVTVDDTPANRGMINQVSYLLEVREA